MQVLVVSYRLEVATNEQDIDLVAVLVFQVLNIAVYCIQLSVTAALHCNLSNEMRYEDEVSTMTSYLHRPVFPVSILRRWPSFPSERHTDLT